MIPRNEQRLLLAHLLHVPREILWQHSITLSEEQQRIYDTWVERRLAGEPVAKIIGKKAFWTHEFITSADTLDPRPETEHLIEAVLRHRPDISAPLRFLDCGTGTGCILLSLLSEYPNTTGLGIDKSEKAIEIANLNKKHLNLHKNATFSVLNWTLLKNAVYDVVVSNPPYIPTHEIASLMPDVRGYDPIEALDGGSDGLSAYRQLLHKVTESLNHHGLFVCEIGQGQEQDVIALAEKTGLVCLEQCKDLSGIIRILVMQKQ